MLDEDGCIVLDARTDPRVQDSSHAATRVFYAGVPLHFDGEPIGVLCIGDTNSCDFDAEQLDALKDLAVLAERELQIAALSEAQIALALSNEELEMKARIDVLTHFVESQCDSGTRVGGAVRRWGRTIHRDSDD